MAEKTSHSQVTRHIKDILLLFGIPIGIILIIVAFLYIPRLFANPSYDFIYCTGYACDQRYAADSPDRLDSTIDTERRFFEESVLHYYDIDRDATRPLSRDEAASYRLDRTSKSPDGYTLQQNRNNGGFLFWDNYNDSWSLKKGIVSKPVSLGGDTSAKQFIGWVLSDGR